MTGLLDGDIIVQRVVQALGQTRELEQQMIEGYMVKKQELENLTQLEAQNRKKLRVCVLCQALFAS